MASIDFSPVANIRPFRLGDAIAQGQSLAANQFRLSDAQDEMRAKQGLRSALQAGTPEAFQEFKKQSPEKAMQYESQNAETEAKKLGFLLSRLTYADHIASGIVDEPTYQSAKAEMQKAGVDVSDFPANYDPAFIDSRRKQALGFKGQAELKLKALDQQLKVSADVREQEKLEETKRHNRATEANAKEAQRIKAENEKPLTESQGNAVAFGMRASEMHKTLDSMEAAGYDPTGIRAAKDNASVGGALTNWLASDKGQAYSNASKNFVAAILRKESGAQISESEWRSGTQLYIPLPGDSKDVLNQKRRNRELAVEALQAQAGKGATKIPAAGAIGAPSIPTDIQKGNYRSLWR